MKKETSKVVPCIYCARELHLPADYQNNTAIETKAGAGCAICFNGFAADKESCFGKQDQSGKSLASDAACKECDCQAACAAWPSNPVKYEPSGSNDQNNQNQGEDEMAATPATTAATTSNKKGGKATAQATQPAAAADPKANKKANTTQASASTKPAAAAKTAANKNATSSEIVAYGNLKYRKGSSIEIASSLIMKKKKQSREDLATALESSGVQSSNFGARIDIAAKALVAEGLITSEKTEKGIIYTVVGK